MSIYFYNTATKHKDEFRPITPGKVSLYTCGPTVYNSQHIGNWVAHIRWDTLMRTLQLSGFVVTRVMNITDVGHLTSDADEGEDKMQKGARREGTTAWDIAKRYSDEFIHEMDDFHIVPPTFVTKATEHIESQLGLVRTLKRKGFTYQISDGIYFDTSKFPAYATFAGLDLDELKAGARVEFNTEKRHSSDFALWKFTHESEKRDMEWETPTDITDDGVTRPGFPGWHLECSAMVMEYLGETIDIHTGGIDHIPVHHTNEIAQSEAATGKPFAHYWLHNAHLLSNGTKISKSLNNGFTLSQITEHGYTALDFKMFVLQSHYHTESNFTWENLAAAKARLAHWRNIANLRWQAKTVEHTGEEPSELTTVLLSARQDALNALQDDLDTPGALKIIDEAFSRLEAGALIETDEAALKQLLAFIDEALGLALVDSTPDVRQEVVVLIQKREEARQAKDWQYADELREELSRQYIGVRDTPRGSVWYRL